MLQEITSITNIRHLLKYCSSLEDLVLNSDLHMILLQLLLAELMKMTCIVRLYLFIYHALMLFSNYYFMSQPTVYGFYRATLYISILVSYSVFSLQWYYTVICCSVLGIVHRGWVFCLCLKIVIYDLTWFNVISWGHTVLFWNHKKAYNLKFVYYSIMEYHKYYRIFLLIIVINK